MRLRRIPSRAAGTSSKIVLAHFSDGKLAKVILLLGLILLLAIWIVFFSSNGEFLNDVRRRGGIWFPLLLLCLCAALYPRERSKRKGPIAFGWGCPCSIYTTAPVPNAYDGWPLLDQEMMPGESRRVGYVFLLSGQTAADEFRRAGGTFYLWEAGMIGEARIVFDESSS